MRRGVHRDARAWSRLPSRFWLLIAVVVLAGIIAGAASVDAASITVSWNAPTTKANGTALTDLAGYRLYLETTQPACPDESFHAVSSPTTTPAAGQTVTQRIAGLNAGATYFVVVTAVDTSGNESACSGSASGVAKSDFSVSPTATTNFGSVTTGSTVERTFTVQNTSTAGLAGTVSVGAPFSIASGASFSLAPGASHTVTVRFQPTSTGTFAGNVNFTASGDTVSRGVSGAATAGAAVTLSVTKTGTGAGTVTSSPAGIACGTDCTEAVTAGTRLTLSATPAAGSVFAGWSGACSGTAACAVTVNTPSTLTATFTGSTSSAPMPPASSTAPGAPATPSVRQVAADASGVTFAVTWAAASGAASYRYVAGFNDGSAAQQGTVTTLSLQVRMPYHSSGAATGGFVCIRSVNAAGQQSADQSCSPMSVPARPAATSSAPVPPASSTAPGAPATTSVRQVAADTSGVTFAVAWAAASGAASYRYVAGFNDGSAAQQGTVTTLSLQVRMPYHSSGAATGGFVCIRSVNAAGQQSADQSCSPLSVPARLAATSSAPTPVTSSLSPTRARAGGAGFTLIVKGDGFVASSVVHWNGAARPTTFVSAKRLRAAISTADRATVGLMPVSVVTPGGGTSGPVGFTVIPAIPAVSGLSPATVGANGASFTLTVNGNHFVASSVVRWNGAARPTTFVSGTQLRAAITAADRATTRSIPVSVVTPAPGGGKSGKITFTISEAAATQPSAPAPTAPAAPNAPGNPTVRQLTADAGGVTFAISWSTGSGAASYRYVAGFNDGSARQQDTVTGLLSVQLRMPYHSSGGASDGFVCIRSVSSSGQQSIDHSCSPVSVPARS